MFRNRFFYVTVALALLVVAVFTIRMALATAAVVSTGNTALDQSDRQRLAAGDGAVTVLDQSDRNAGVIIPAGAVGALDQIDRHPGLSIPGGAASALDQLDRHPALGAAGSGGDALDQSDRHP